MLKDVYLKIFSLFAILFVAGCEMAPLVFNPGELTTETREMDISDVRHLYISNDINVIFEKSFEEKITVEAGKNLIDKVETRLDDTTLYLSDKNYNNWGRGYKDHITIHISHPHISKITFNGSALLESKDTLFYKKDESLTIQTGDATGSINLVVDASKLQINHWFGVADIAISGKARECLIGNTGRGRLSLEDLRVEHMHINNKSINDAYVNISKSLQGIIYSTGNIYYYGNPEIDMEYLGAGKLISLTQ